MVNIYTTFANQQSYTSWADTAHLPLYREIVPRFVASSPALLVLPVAAYAIAVAVTLFMKGWVVKLGIVGAMLFLLSIMPLGWAVVANVALIASLALLLRHEDEHSIAALVRARPHRPPPAPISWRRGRVGRSAPIGGPRPLGPPTGGDGCRLYIAGKSRRSPILGRGATGASPAHPSPFPQVGLSQHSGTRRTMTTRHVVAIAAVPR